MWKLKALKGSSCGVGCYQSHITVKPTARLFVETSNYFKRRYFNCRSLMTGMKHAIHLMKRTLTSDKRAKIDEVIRYCFAIVLSSQLMLAIFHAVTLWGLLGVTTQTSNPSHVVYTVGVFIHAFLWAFFTASLQLILKMGSYLVGLKIKNYIAVVV